MKSFQHSPARTTAPRADEAWAPPQMRRAMREMAALPLGERIARAVVRCAETATREHPGGTSPCEVAFRDVAWDIMLQLLFAESHGRTRAADAIAAAEGVAPGEGADWIDAFEGVGLVERSGLPGSRSARSAITVAAKRAMIELLLEPASWNGVVLSRDITMWQLAQRAQVHAQHD